ncbi:MAG: dienelactone hydrolase family protein [Gammaproteobacteria bacterium]
MSRLLKICVASFACVGVISGASAQDDELSATADAHRHDEPVATPAATTAPRMKVVGDDVVYGSVDGRELQGYLVRPSSGGEGLPAVIVIHEWWGLNDNIRRAADRLAGEGYVALAVDLYDGAVAAVPKDAMKLMSKLTENQASADENLRQAYGYLDGAVGAPRIGSIGWCLGGRWSLRTALLLPDELDAAVIYYGTVVTDEAQLASLAMPVLGNFAENDPIIPLETVDAFETAMKNLGKEVDIKIYAGAKHAFSNPSGMAYDPVAAADAWERTTAFLRQNLGGD